MLENIQLVENRYERLEQISWWDQNRLRDARVLVAGAGALGNEILKNLALLGIGNILVVDFDTIEISNLTRSILFRASDQGRPKAEVAVERVMEINPDCRAVAVVGDLRWDLGLGIYRRMDVVLAGLDSIGARVALNEMCWKAGVPWVDGGLGDFGGVMRVFVPPEGSCYECNLAEDDYREMNIRYSCQRLRRDDLIEGHVPTTPTTASVIAAWQVQEAVKWMHDRPVSSSQGVYYNGMDHTLFIVKYPRREECPAHEVLEDIVLIPEASVKLTVNQLLDILGERFGAPTTVELDREVVRRMRCPRCGADAVMLSPLSRLTHRDGICPKCGAERSITSTHRLDHTTTFGSATLKEVGIPPLHILKAKAKDGQMHHFELTGDMEFGFLAGFVRGGYRNGNS